MADEDESYFRPLQGLRSLHFRLPKENYFHAERKAKQKGLFYRSMHRRGRLRVLHYVRSDLSRLRDCD
jgi:hypothetical protein